MKLEKEEHIVMTLDAGGTKFIFSAIQGMKEIIEPIKFPSNSDNLEECLAMIVDGFFQLRDGLSGKPTAISFAFPGPADYPNGIIGNLSNLPAFQGRVALGSMLEEKFGLPVFINNDGDLFAFGEAIAGFLPEINKELKKVGSAKQYKNLFGVTLGTGFGGGFASNGELFFGDNSIGAEIWLMRSGEHTRTFAGETVSIRAIRRSYAQKTKTEEDENLTPKEIFEIAKGERRGDREAAKESFIELGSSAGDALTKALTLFDGLVVIGGGLSGAAEFILPSIVSEMNSSISRLNGKQIPGLLSHVFNLENKSDFRVFMEGERKTIKVPGSDKKISYDPMKRIGVGISRLGTSKAIAIGAYAFALKHLK